MQETEITVELLESVDYAKKKLDTEGFEIVEEVVMTDYYISKFSTEELLAMDYSEIIRNSFIIRQVISPEETSLVLLYKDKTVDGNNNVIAEQKVKCPIENLQKALQIFDLCKLNCWCEIKQVMTVFKKGKIQFAMQEVENLGTFIEYEEDDDMKDMSEYEKIELLLSRLRDIGLELGDDYSCKKVYMKFKGR